MKKKNSELPKIRIDTELYNKMNEVLKLSNDNELGVEISMSTFRRMAYSFFINSILVEGLDVSLIPIKD